MDWAALGANVDEPRPAFPNLTRTNRPLSAPASRGPQSTVAAIVRGFSFPDIDFNSERAPIGAAAGCAPPNDRIQVSGGVVLRLSGDCARHHSSCGILRLRFNLPQPGVSIIRAAPQDRLAPPKNQPRPVGQLRANHHKIQASGMALASATKSLLRELAY
jgi:hypothetical protein